MGQSTNQIHSILEWETIACGDVRHCRTCGSNQPFAENDELCYVCTSCGTIDRSSMAFDMRPPFERPDPFARKVFKCIRSEDPWHRRSMGRYKEKFHLNERISQWRCRDPLIPSSDWKRIEGAARSGKYGRKEDFSRATVITLTRDLKMQKYRERWKSILRKLNPPSEEELDEMDATINPEVVKSLGIMFGRFVEVFAAMRSSMPRSVARKPGAPAVAKTRHNFISFNYALRKELEMLGIWDYHDEFPVPRSHTKLHALDDVMEKMCKELKLDSKFVRSTVIKRPKLTK